MKRALTCFVLMLWIYSTGCHNRYEPSLEKPLIGITTVYHEENHSNTVRFTYVEAVLNSGGVPIVLPTIKNEEIIDHYVEMLDGLVLVGGRDIPPEMYDQAPHETTVILPERRVFFERVLIARWLVTKKPILGICLGMQFTNVVLGGSLIQDIPSQVGTEVIHRGASHSIQIEPDSVLFEILGSNTVSVNSFHHQAVDRIGQGLKPIAYTNDGIVEALQRTDGGMGLFVQWHPEAMTQANSKHTQAIFDYLIGLSELSSSNIR